MENEIRESFIRQRRNLMIVSLFLILQEVVGLEIKTISFLGNTAYIENPAFIEVFFWVLLGYWFVRFSQLLVDLKDTGSRRRFFQIRQFYFDFLVPNEMLQSLENKGLETLASENSGQQPNLTSRTLEQLSIWRPSCVIKAEFESPETGEISRAAQRVELPRWFNILMIIISGIHLVILTRAFTEYLLPLILALVPLLNLILGSPLSGLSGG